MQTQIKESEIEFCEFYSDPTALTECLVPENMNAPQVWPECDCITLRPYQFAMQNYSYLIANNPVLSQLENFKFKKMAGDLYSIGSRNTGKCEHIENECQLADGSVKKFGDLIGTTQNVIAFNDKTLKLEKDIAHYADNGIKPCYKIVTMSGKEIIVTDNHPLYTNNGWIEAKDLEKNIMIATPRKININGCVDADENLAKLIGYLLGDGSCNHDAIGITNINKDIIQEIYMLAKYFDCEVRNQYMTYYFRKNSDFKGSKIETNNIKKMVLKYGLNVLSKKKTIHSDIYKWNNKSIALLLNRLFACDGHIQSEKRNHVFEITLASKKLIYQIQTLLLRFGIHSNINYKNAVYDGKNFDAWRLYVDRDIDILIKKIGVFTKDRIKLKIKQYATSDLIPKNLIKKYKHELQKPCLLGDKRKYGFSRNKIKEFTNNWMHPNLFKLTNSDIYWEIIKSVEYVGKLPTVIVSVDKNHTYISNNIISHNSLWLIIDVVLAFIHQCKEGCVASVTAEKLKKVTEPICKFVESHKFLKVFHLEQENTRSKTVKRDPLTLNSEHGAIILSANEKIDSDNPGVQYQGKHWDIRWTEEYSYSTKRGQEQAEDAEMSYGHIERPSGIPDLHTESPLDKILKDKKLKNWIWRLPQYVRSDWTDEVEEQKAQKYNGRQSSAYKLNVEAETLEGAFNFFDMARFKEASFRKSGRIKTFEIGRETYEGFENRIHVERMAGSEQIYICADIGSGSAPTEIIIVFFDGKNFKYAYNISLYRLIQDEQAEIFYWLFNQLEGAFVAIDATHDGGVIIDRLKQKGIDSEYLLKVKFNENIDVDFERDENDEPKMNDNNEPIMKQAHTEAWSFSELEAFLYDGTFKIPPDAKLEEQFSNIICKRTKLRVLFDSKGPNHLVQAFQVFAICKFFNKFNILRRQYTKTKRAFCSFIKTNKDKK